MYYGYDYILNEKGKQEKNYCQKSIILRHNYSDSTARTNCLDK